MRRVSWFVVVLGLVALARCGDSEEWKNVKTQAGETWDAVKTWSVARRGDAEEFFSKSMEDLGQGVAAAKAKAQAAGGDVADTLDSSWDGVSVKLAELKAAGADQWDQAREAFVKAYEAVKHDVSSDP